MIKCHTNGYHYWVNYNYQYFHFKPLLPNFLFTLAIVNIILYPKGLHHPIIETIATNLIEYVIIRFLRHCSLTVRGFDALISILFCSDLLLNIAID